MKSNRTAGWGRRTRKGNSTSKMTQRKVWVREWLTRMSEFRQYDNLLTELQIDGQRGYKNYSRITSDLFKEMSWHDVHCHALARILPHCHDDFTNSWCIDHDPFTKFCRDQNFETFQNSRSDLSRSHDRFAHTSL